MHEESNEIGWAATQAGQITAVIICYNLEQLHEKMLTLPSTFLTETNLENKLKSLYPWRSDVTAHPSRDSTGHSRTADGDRASLRPTGWIRIAGTRRARPRSRLKAEWARGRTQTRCPRMRSARDFKLYYRLKRMKGKKSSENW